jgi:hypothetical protein
VEDYPFSTINAHHQLELLPFPIYPWKWSGDWLKWGNFQVIKDWLNDPYSETIQQHLQTALKHRFFTIPKSRTTRRIPHEIGDDLEMVYQLAPFEADELLI